MKFIAEVKSHSPYGFSSSYTWDELFGMANEIGDIISIHTDKRWHGSFELITRAKKLTSKPILAKGIHSSDEDIKRAIDLGADYVLVVGRVPKVHLNKIIIEPYTISELKNIDPKLKVLWNSRELKDGTLKKETFSDARKLFKGWLVQASNIKSNEDIDPNADAVLIGQHLANFYKSK